MKPLYVLGIVSVFGLVSVVKKRSSEKIVSICALLIAAICLFLSKGVGTTGGEVRHTEIRENTSKSNASEGNTETKTTDDKD